MTQQYCTNCGEQLAEDAQFCSACGEKVNSSIRPRQRKTREKARTRFPWPIIVGGALLLIAGIWWVSNPSAPTALPTATAAVQQPTEASEIPYPTVPRADIADVKADLDAGAAVVVDVRDLQYYQEARIPGAVNLPSSSFDLEYQSLPQDQMIYLYCT